MDTTAPLQAVKPGFAITFEDFHGHQKTLLIESANALTAFAVACALHTDVQHGFISMTHVDVEEMQASGTGHVLRTHYNYKK